MAYIRYNPKPKFEVSNSRNNFLGIMVLEFYVKYAVYEFKMSSKVTFDPAILTGSKKPSWSQNFIYLT